MQVELGAHVSSSDGHDVGRIDKLIVDAHTSEVTAIVLRQGLLLHRDVQVPLSTLQPDPAGGWRLTATAAQLAELPAYVDPSASAYAYSGETHPDVVAMLSQHDLAHAVIKEGSPVKDRTGKTVGSVHRLTFDPAGGHLTHLAVRQGLLFTHDVELPAALIAGIGEGEVTLTVMAAEVQRWGALRAGLDVYTTDEVCLGTISRRTDDYLEVAGAAGRPALFVPLAKVSQVGEERVLVAANAAAAGLWRTPPGTEEPLGTAGPSA